MVKIKPSA
ncbi:hypothetical protein Nmel_003075 [Mimus melanotis]